MERWSWGGAAWSGTSSRPRPAEPADTRGDTRAHDDDDVTLHNCGPQRIATEAHAGQVDQAGEPYIGHLARTAAGAAATAPDGLRAYATMAAWLHDSIEDTAITEADLTRQGVPAEVVAAVVLVTKSPGVDMHEYLTRISGNPIALLVKTADMNDNADEAHLSVLPQSTPSGCGGSTTTTG